MPAFAPSQHPLTLFFVQLDLRKIIRSISGAYGDRYDHQRQNNIFQKFIGSTDRDLYACPERVWAERKYLDLQYEAEKLEKQGTPDDDDRMILLKRKASRLFSELLLLRGDFKQMEMSADLCRENENHGEFKAKDVLKHIKTIVDEVSQTPKSYFDVYRRDTIRHARIFSMAAVELWSESNFLQTRDARTIFLQEDLNDKSMVSHPVHSPACQQHGPVYCT